MLVFCCSVMALTLAITSMFNKGTIALVQSILGLALALTGAVLLMLGF